MGLCGSSFLIINTVTTAPLRATSDEKSRGKKENNMLTSFKINELQHALYLWFSPQSFPGLDQKPLMLSMTIETENSRLKVCYASEAGRRRRNYSNLTFTTISVYIVSWIIYDVFPPPPPPPPVVVVVVLVVVTTTAIIWWGQWQCSLWQWQ